MSILFLSTGILTTIQDLGRLGFRRFGVNPNGAMDRKAVSLINVLLGNDENEAVLEIHFPAPKILFEESAIIALGGADFDAKIDESEIENWRPYFIEKGQTLSFSGKNFGNRIYLSVKGGFHIESWLKSASTNLKAKIGGFAGRTIQKNDCISFKKTNENKTVKFNFKLSPSIIPHYLQSPKIRVIEGSEFSLLNALSELNFLKNYFKIALNSDRMGFRLIGEPLYLLENLELVSSGVSFGTIQLLPNGQLIILMADAQTTGGYPRLAHVISEDLPLIAQLGANDNLSFDLVSLSEAEESALEFERDLNFLKFGIKEKSS